MIFSIDGILFLESTIPECRGFTGMGWFVFITLAFNTMAILSNPDCLDLFYIETISGVLFTIGFGLVIYLIVQRRKDTKERAEFIGDQKMKTTLKINCKLSFQQHVFVRK